MEEFLIKNYSKIGSRICAESLKLKISSICNKAYKLKLKVNSKVRSKNYSNSRRKTLLTDEYQKIANDFINFNTPEHVYVLGLIWADGHISKNRNRITCSIVQEDGENLKDIFLKVAPWQIRIINKKSKDGYKRKPQMCFQISNYILTDFLKNNGYISKSWESADKILSKIPEHLKYYWFRGLIDGDGNVGEYCFSISSGIKQDWKYMKRICKKLNIKYYIYQDIRKNKGTSNFRISKLKNIYPFGNFIYKNRETDNIGLDRKYKQWITIKNKEINNRIVVQIDIKTGQVLKTFNSIAEASDKLNLKRTHICGVIKGRCKTHAGFVWKYINGIKY